MAAHLLAVAIALALAACSSEDSVSSGPPGDAGNGAEDAAPPARYTRDAELRINQLQAKGTHNSYHIAPEPGSSTLSAVPDWQYTRQPLDVQLTEQGVRAMELDTNYDRMTGAVNVLHVPTVDSGTTCPTFADCLTTLLGWSDANPGHHILFLQIEPKDVEFVPVEEYSTFVAAYADAVDQVIRDVWPRERVLTPDDVQGGAATLRDGVTGGGWPSLGEARDKIVFFLNERQSFHEAYTLGGTSLAGRMMFPESRPDEPIASFVVMNDPLGDPIRETVDAGLIVRTRTDGFPKPADFAERREAALASAAQLLSTDFPVPADGDPGFQVPGGTPSRCNPATAPEDCTSADIETPAE